MSRSTGYTVLGVSTVGFLYYVVWVLVTPFLADDLGVQDYFPDKIYAFILAAGVLLFVVTVALTVIGCGMFRHNSDEDLSQYYAWQASRFTLQTPQFKEE